MPKFMFVYRGGKDTPPREEMSPEQMQQSLQGWMSWIKSGIDAGWIVDGGDGLTPNGKVVASDGTVTDGPFAESKELVGGYSLVEAENIDAAVKLTEGCPMFLAGGSVEVRELMNTGDM